MYNDTIKTYSSGSGIDGYAEGGGPRFFSLSAILAAAFFLSSNILANSSALGGAGVGKVESASNAVGVAIVEGLAPKPGMRNGSVALGRGAGLVCDGGKGGKDGICCEGANGGIL